MLPQVGLSTDDPVAKRLRDAVTPGSDILSVPRVGNGSVGTCYQNVREHVQGNAGSMQLGYILCQFPGHFLEALHHAVWKSPEGTLLDVTGPAFPAMAEPFVTFVLDYKTQIPLLLEPKIPSWFIVLDAQAGTTECTRLTRKNMQLSGQVYSMIEPYVATFKAEQAKHA